jgi:molecular chaperone DnaK (HSP70)
MSETEIHVFGIDLGTTYSCIARVDPTGRPEVIYNFEGDAITPSVVFFDGDKRVVGEEARNHAIVSPFQVVEMVKTQMGSDWRFEYDGTSYSPEEISSFILRKVVQDAEAQLGFPVKDVVITCPAYFGVREKTATKNAGEIAGLNVLSIITEPIAAAIANGLQDDRDRVIVVYDLGGGTFDTTLIEVKGGALTVITTDGDHHLGGRQWDEVLVSYCADQWMQTTGMSDNPLDDPEVTQELFQNAEKGKKALTARVKTDVAVAHMGKRELVSVTRETFDGLTKHLLEQTVDLTRKMLAAAAAPEKGHSTFDEILLVGGSTRMPQVKERLEAEFPGSPIKSFDPDLAVAKGAAIYAWKLSLDRMYAERFPDAPADAGVVQQRMTELAAETGVAPDQSGKLMNARTTIVTPRSFGTDAYHDVDGRQVLMVANLIKVNDQLPREKTMRFYTMDANQEAVDCRFFETLSSADSVDLVECQEIGGALLELPANLPGRAPIDVTFKLDEQGLLEVTAREPSGGKFVETQITTEGGISADELTAAAQRSRRLVIS